MGDKGFPAMTYSDVLPGSRRGWFFAGSVMAGGLLLGALIMGFVLIASERAPAIRVLAQADAGEMAANEGRILIYSKINRVRSCKIETTHWIFTTLNHNGEMVRAYVPIAEDGPVPIRTLGLSSYVLSVPLPPGLWPGEWYWLESRAEFCGPLGWLFPIYSESSPLRIDIERARAVSGVPVTAERDGKTVIRSRSPVPSVGQRTGP